MSPISDIEIFAFSSAHYHDAVMPSMMYESFYYCHCQTLAVHIHLQLIKNRICVRTSSQFAISHFAWKKTCERDNSLNRSTSHDRIDANEMSIAFCANSYLSSIFQWNFHVAFSTFPYSIFFCLYRSLSLSLARWIHMHTVINATDDAYKFLFRVWNEKKVVGACTKPKTNEKKNKKEMEIK